MVCRNDNGLKEQGQDDYLNQHSVLLTLPTYISPGCLNVRSMLC